MLIKTADLGAVGHAPEPRCAILARRREGVTIGGKRRPEDPASVLQGFAHSPPLAKVPDPGRAILGGGGEQPAVRREVERVDPTLMRLEPVAAAERAAIPHLHAGIIAAAGHRRAVRRKPHVVHASDRLSQDPLRLQRGGVPESDH